jgi:hypothetical protein
MNRWIWVGLWLCGCDGLGRAVVGERTLGQTDEICRQPLPCEPLEIAPPESVPTATLPVDFRECSQACASTTVGECVPAESSVETELPAELACARARLEEPARVEVGTWTWVHVEVESAAPATLELVGGTLEHVSLTLRGPITLRITDLERVRDLRVLAPEGRAQIELQRTDMRVLAVAAPEAALLLRRSNIERATLEVEQLDVESSAVSDTIWRASSLSMTDATVKRVHSEIARSVLSASDVRKSSFLGCQSLTAVQTVFDEVRLHACAEEAGLYGASFLRSQLEGNLILDGAGIDESVLGVGEVGTIMAWDTRLKGISFCADQHALSFGGGTSLRCGHCDLTPEPAEPAACQLPLAQSAVENCGSCQVLTDVLPACGDPLPERMRPPRH